MVMKEFDIVLTLDARKQWHKRRDYLIGILGIIGTIEQRHVIVKVYDASCSRIETWWYDKSELEVVGNVRKLKP